MFISNAIVFDTGKIRFFCRRTSAFFITARWQEEPNLVTTKTGEVSSNSMCASIWEREYFSLVKKVKRYTIAGIYRVTIQ